MQEKKVDANVLKKKGVGKGKRTQNRDHYYNSNSFCSNCKCLRL